MVYLHVREHNISQNIQHGSGIRAIFACVDVCGRVRVRVRVGVCACFRNNLWREQKMIGRTTRNELTSVQNVQALYLRYKFSATNFCDNDETFE